MYDVIGAKADNKTTVWKQLYKLLPQHFIQLSNNQIISNLDDESDAHVEAKKSCNGIRLV